MLLGVGIVAVLSALYTPSRTRLRTGVPRADALQERQLVLPCDPETGCIAALLTVPPLPQLDDDEERLLRSGERLQWQQPPSAGGVGSGFIVRELTADANHIWQAVSAFGRYDELIKTVRTVTPYDDDGPLDTAAAAALAADATWCRYTFIVSRIRLRLDVRFSVDTAQRCAMWQLDKQSWVLQDSTGYWRVEQCADRPNVVRVWFCVSVKLSKRVPGFVVRLVSRLGLDKATRWLKELES